MLRISEQVSLDQVCCKIADIVTSDALPDQNKFLEMRALGDFFLSKVAKQIVQVSVKRLCECHPQSAAAVSAQAKAKAVLFYFRKAIPSFQQTVVHSTLNRFVPEKLEIANDLIV